MSSEFDYQWNQLPSPKTEYNHDRVKELLKFTKIDRSWFRGKDALDAGCGNGRYTYALQELGCTVDSVDVSDEAVKKCLNVNPKAVQMNILDLPENRKYEFVLCWGVIHHNEVPQKVFNHLSKLVKPNGILHIMVYHKKMQTIYEPYRKTWPTLNEVEKKSLCVKLAKQYGGEVHGWWDALNPKWNWSFTEDEVKKWFLDENFRIVRLTKKYNINMNGVKKC